MRRLLLALLPLAIALPGGLATGCGSGGDPDDPGGGGGDGAGAVDGGPGDEPDAGGGPISTPVMPILEEDGFYPRAIELPDGRILASIVAPQPGSGRLGGTILESLDGGVTFETVGRIDGDHSAGGLCCASIYRLPKPLGALPAGAILWSASVGGDAPGAPMSIPLFSSVDDGRSWSYLSTITVAAVPRSQGGLWEPELSQLDDGSLVCHHADETDPGHSQKLVARRSTDGLSWPEVRETAAMAPFGARPGMPVVRRTPDGRFAMTFEICGTDGCATHLRFSDDGWDWGSATDPGLRPATIDGEHFRHAPTLVVGPGPGGRDRFYLVGQMLHDRAGAVAADNGAVILVNTEGGHGHWYKVPAPVPVPEAYDNFCPNYSSAVLPLEGGRVALEIASKWDGNRCRSYYARGPLGGTGDAAGLEDGASYRMRPVMSGHCLDVENGSAAPGANLRQWDCNGSGAQRFTIDLADDGTARLAGAASGLCLVTDGEGPGANVAQGPCETAPRWRIENLGRAVYRLTRPGGDLCLDVAGGSTAIGGNVQQWTCNHLAPQIWHLD